MKEWQNAEQPLIFVERDDFAALLHVGEQVELRKHDAFGFAGAAAGKNNRRQIIQPGAGGAEHPFQ